MQNAKDTFYMTLRDRLAAVNPARTMVLRGVTRPGFWWRRTNWCRRCRRRMVLPAVDGAAGGFAGAADAGVDAVRDSVLHGWQLRGMAGWIAGGCWRGWMRSWLRR